MCLLFLSCLQFEKNLYVRVAYFGAAYSEPLQYVSHSGLMLFQLPLWHWSLLPLRRAFLGRERFCFLFSQYHPVKFYQVPALCQAQSSPISVAGSWEYHRKSPQLPLSQSLTGQHSVCFQRIILCSVRTSSPLRPLSFHALIIKLSHWLKGFSLVDLVTVYQMLTMCLPHVM